MTVTVYRFDDADAPVLTAEVGSIVTLLDACLVNGYGAKPGAGWSKPFAAVNQAVYQQGAGSNGFFLQVDGTVQNYPIFRGFTAMSDMVTGTGQFPTTVQLASGLRTVISASFDATPRPWLIAADSKRFYLYICQGDPIETGLTGTTRPMLQFFGDIISYRIGDAYHFLLIAGTSMSSSKNYSGSVNSAAVAIDGHYMARGANQITEAVQYSKLTDIRGVYPSTGIQGMGAYGTAFPEGITGGMLLSPVLIMEPTTILTRGHLPGLWAPLHNAPGTPGATFEGTTEGGLAGKTFILLNCLNAANNCRVALEISDTWE